MLKSKLFSKLFLSSMCILQQVSGSVDTPNARIVGGSKTTINQAPFLIQIFLLNGGGIHCGGALVSDYYVVTAAHCVMDSRAEDVFVVGGITNRYSGDPDAEVSYISEIHMHPEFNKNTKNMDIAVMKLMSPFTYVAKAQFCSHEWKPNDPVKLFGWGMLHEADYDMPTQLQTVNLAVLDKHVCEEMYKRESPLTDSMFCATAPGKDSCQGDSGGPVLVNNDFCGVVSWGIGCGRIQYPGVYTSIPKSMPFLTSIIQF